MTTTDTAFDSPALDHFADDALPPGMERPERTEDRVDRDRWGKPRILPLGESMPTTEAARKRALRSYYRPSSFAEVLENHYNLERWSERMMANGLMAERRLRAAYAAIGPTEESSETKEAANNVLAEAKKAARARDKADEGTAVHALTERHDLGLPISFVPDEFAGNLDDWKRLTACFEIIDVECFVVEDQYRLAGTFDRLVKYYEPCPNCGAVYYIADLKTGTIQWGGMKMGAQLGIYAHGAYYDPATGLRTPLPQVCQCRGIIFHIPSGQPYGSGERKWLNIGQGWNLAVRLAHEVREARKKSNWWLDFTEGPNIPAMVSDATTREELVALYRLYKSHWREEHTMLVNVRLTEIASSNGYEEG